MIHQNEVKRYSNVVSLIKKWCLNRNGRRKCNNKVIDGNVDINANEIANSMNGKIYCINSENNINEVLLTLFQKYIGARENSNPQNKKNYYSNNNTHCAPHDLSSSSFRKGKVNKESIETKCLEVLLFSVREDTNLTFLFALCGTKIVTHSATKLEKSLWLMRQKYY